MPSYIVKINPEDDLYTYWSTIVDAPLFLGTRAELTDYLLREARDAGVETAADERFERADRTGTSSVDGFYDWGEKDFIVEQRGVVLRADIPELVRCIQAREPYPHILRPFEDWD